MTNFRTIVAVVLRLCSITSLAGVEIGDGSETIRLDAPNCAISDLRNVKVRREQNVRTRIIIENCWNPSIPSGAFDNVGNVISIDIIASSVNGIDANAFDGLNVLEQLSVTHNNLTTFHVWSVDNLSALTTLNLDANRIEELEVNALRPYPNLVHLSMAYNSIKEIPTGFFGKISELQTLYLNGNHIERIMADTFKPLLQLEHLQLGSNEISFVDERAFATLAHLISLRLDGNQITTLAPTLLLASPRLQLLNLSHNSLDALSLTFQDNVELKAIDVSFNSLSTLRSESLEGVQSLEVR